MEKNRAVTLTLMLGMALVAGPALAGPGTQYAGEEIGKIRYIDRAQNLVELDDGMQLYATNQRMLDGLREGDTVKVDFSFNGDRAYLNSIAPPTADDSTGTSVSTQGGVKQH